MQTVSKFVVAYAIDSIWLLPLLVLTAEIAMRMLGRTRGKLLHRVWLICLGLTLIVPAIPLLNIQLGQPGFHAGSGSIPGSGQAQANIRGGMHLPFSGELSQSQPKLSQIAGPVLMGFSSFTWVRFCSPRAVWRLDCGALAHLSTSPLQWV